MSATCYQFAATLCDVSLACEVIGQLEKGRIQSRSNSGTSRVVQTSGLVKLILAQLSSCPVDDRAFALLKPTDDVLGKAAKWEKR